MMSKTKRNKTINLPSQDEMLQRLLTVDDDNHIQQKFYPMLLQAAGSQKVAVGVVMLLQLAMYDYTESLPPAIGAIMKMQMPSFIDALCPDGEVAKDAKAFWEKTQEI